MAIKLNVVIEGITSQTTKSVCWPPIDSNCLSAERASGFFWSDSGRPRFVLFLITDKERHITANIRQNLRREGTKAGRRWEGMVIILWVTIDGTVLLVFGNE